MKMLILALMSILCLASCASQSVCSPEQEAKKECSKKATIQERTTPRGGVY